jgi:hypothetical protein
MTVRIVLLAVPVVALTWLPPATAADPFTARFEDGRFVSGTEIRAWQDTKASPELRRGGEKHPLLSAGNHARWLRNNELPLPSAPAAYVEFVGGDRLPGKVTAYRTGGENPLDRQPPHLIVEHRGVYDWPTQERETLRVGTAWLRRIVWRSAGNDRYEPGTLFTRDGRRVAYRSLRFGPTGARLLLDEGTQNVPFADMAELHLPRSDPWQSYYDQLAQLSPDGAARLVRIETADGLIATASMERFVARRHESDQPQHWFHMVQPAWSLDPLWARFRTICFWRFGLPHQVRLSDIDPIRRSESPGGGSHWMWRKDRNVQGGLLRAGGEDYGWGIGDHAPSALSFPLPVEARGFRAKLALDQIAGSGGCARALVHLGDATTPVFRSELLIGSKSVVSTPAIALPSPSGSQVASRTLTLAADAAHRERPAGADPLNIRDFVDWLEPELELDRDELARELRRRAASAVAAWEGWTLASRKGNVDLSQAVELSNWWDESERGEQFRHAMRLRQSGLLLKRTLKLTPADEWLCLAVNRPKDDSRVTFGVRINGKLVGEFDLPKRRREQPDPVVVPLHDYRGQAVTLEILLPDEAQDTRLEWRGIAISENRPGLLRLFDEESQFASRLNAGDGKAEVISTDRYLGKLSIRVAPPERGAARLLATPVPIRERPGPGEFRYLRLAWKKKGGDRIAVQIGHDGRLGPDDAKDMTPGKSFCLDAGVGPPSFGSAVRLKGEAPREWSLAGIGPLGGAVDLYAEFGRFDLTGLSLAAVDGEYALFDHIYLARTLDDLQKIEVRPAAK